MVDNDNFCSFCLFAHLTNITICIETAFHPCTLIAISSHFATNIGWQLESQRLKIAGETRVRVVGDIYESLEITVLCIELQARALRLQAIKTKIVSHTFDESGIKVFDMFLHKRNIFVEKLLL